MRYWIQQFSQRGPAALDSENLGGRRTALLALAEGKTLLASLRPQAQAGRWVTAIEVRAAVEDGPELNPVEPVWDYVREHCFANRALPTLGHVDPQLCEAFRELGRHARAGALHYAVRMDESGKTDTQSV